MFESKTFVKEAISLELEQGGFILNSTFQEYVGLYDLVLCYRCRRGNNVNVAMAKNSVVGVSQT